MTANTTVVKTHKYSDVIIFELGKELLALNLSIVKEVIEINHIKPFPLAGEKIQGIINLRGQVLPVLNMKKILNLPSGTEEEKRKFFKILIVEHSYEKFGFVVDEIHKIEAGVKDLFLNIPDTLPTMIDIEYIENTGMLNKQPLIFLNIDRIIEGQFSQIPIIKTTGKTMRQDKEIQKYIDQMQTSSRPEDLKFTLTDPQADALKELANIAAGNAITALGELLSAKKKIELFVSSVEVVEIADIPEILGGPDSMVFAVKSEVLRELQATNYLLFPFDGLSEMLYQISGIDIRKKKVGTLADLDKEEKSAIEEIGNIVTAHYISAISDFLRIKMYKESPQLGFDMLGSLIDSFLIDQSQHLSELVCLHTSMRIEAYKVNGAFLFLPHKNSLKKLVEQLTVENIVEILDGKRKTQNRLQAAIETQDQGSLIPINPQAKPVSKPEKIASKLEPEAKKSVKTTARAAAKKAGKTVAESGKNVANAYSPADLDIFSELGNIGAGHASNALSQMINKKVMIDVPNVSLMTVEKIGSTFKQIGETITGTFSLVSKNVDANILLIFSVESMEHLLQIVLELAKPKKLRSLKDITENEQSAIMELNSILIGHYISALSNFLRIPIDPPKHQFFFETADNFFKNLEQQTDKNVISVVIETKMDVIGTEPIIGYFIMIPSEENLQAILKRIQEIWQK